MTEISFNLFSHSFLYEKGHKIASILVNSPLFDIRIIKRFKKKFYFLKLQNQFFKKTENFF